MWKNWLNGILGFWVVIIPFLNFSLAWQRTVLIFSGIVIAVLGFWSFYEIRPRRLPVDGQNLNETIRPSMPDHSDGGQAVDAPHPPRFAGDAGGPEEKKIEI